MTQSEIDYTRKRTRFHCCRICVKEQQQHFDFCKDYSSEKSHGLMKYTYFADAYRKFGQALPYTVIYEKLKSYLTAIEKNYGLLKENRYRLEHTNTYRGFDNILIHAIEHDITLPQDIIFNFQKYGKISPVIKP